MTPGVAESRWRLALILIAPVVAIFPAQSAPHQVVRAANLTVPVVASAFVDAYDSRDTAGVLATLASPQSGRLRDVIDCDYAFFRMGLRSGRQSDPAATRLTDLRRWLAVRFAESDQYNVTGISVQSKGGSTTAVVQAVRSSDVLSVARLDPDHAQLALTFDGSSRAKITSMHVSSAVPCTGRRSPGLDRAPASPSRTRTRALLGAFVVAYDAADLRRVLQLFDSYPQYFDCSGHTVADYSGRVQVTARLRYRFSHGDHLQIRDIRFGDPAHPGIAELDATRGTRTGARVGVGFKVVTTVAGLQLHAMVSELCDGSPAM